MIQRIQSVYLLVAAILMAVVVCMPLSELEGASGNTYSYTSLGFLGEGSQPEYSTWGLFACALGSALLSLIAIFLFKKRKVQLRLSYLSVFLIILFYALFGSYLGMGQVQLDATFSNVEFGLALPIIALIFVVMAIVKIKADEKLVQSLNRIR